VIQLTRNRKSKCRSYRSQKPLLQIIKEDEELDTDFDDKKLVDKLQENVLSDGDYKLRIPFFEKQHENFTNETNFKEKILKLKQIYEEIWEQILFPENNHPNLTAMLIRIGSHIKKQYNNALTKLNKTDRDKMPELKDLPQMLNDDDE